MCMLKEEAWKQCTTAEQHYFIDQSTDKPERGETNYREYFSMDYFRLLSGVSHQAT